MIQGTGDLADADLVTALVKPADHLKRRAEAHIRSQRLTIPFSVGIELLFVAQKHGIMREDFLAAASLRFDMEQRDVLLTAARALDRGKVATVFDAIHASEALLRGVRLHTTDERLLASPFPTASF